MDGFCRFLQVAKMPKVQRAPRKKARCTVTASKAPSDQPHAGRPVRRLPQRVSVVGRLHQRQALEGLARKVERGAGPGDFIEDLPKHWRNRSGPGHLKKKLRNTGVSRSESWRRQRCVRPGSTCVQGLAEIRRRKKSKRRLLSIRGRERGSAGPRNVARRMAGQNVQLACQKKEEPGRSGSGSAARVGEKVAKLAFGVACKRGGWLKLVEKEGC